MDRRDNRIIVYGAGGHAKVLLATLQTRAEHHILGLLDDDGAKHGGAVRGYPILGGRELLPALRDEGVSLAVLAVGYNSSRAALARMLKANGFQPLTLVHPTAVVLPGSRIGSGTVVLPHAFVGGDACLGENGIVSIQVIVGHDSRVGECVQLCPGVKLGGQSEVGDFSFLGMGAVVLPRVRVGQRTIVGANAVVNRDLPDGVTAAGVPARIMSRRTELP